MYKESGDPLGYGSCRTVKLFEQEMKVFERVLERRIQKKVKIDKMQVGFIIGKEQIQNVL